MAKFILIYRGGNPPESAEQGAKHRQDWNEWANNLGDALTEPGNPVGKSRFVSSQGVSDSGVEPTMGYSIVDASDLDEAVSMVENCPHLEIGGTMEVAEIMQMPT